MKARYAAHATTAVFATLSCQIPSLELSGKACPCVDGFTCDEARNVCVEGDLIFEDDFKGGLSKWSIVRGDWSTNPNGALQRDPAVDAVMLATGFEAARYYRVETRFRRRTGGDEDGAMEIVVRFGSSGMYHCNYEPGTGKLFFQREDSTGTISETIPAPVAGLPPDPDAWFTMNVELRPSESGERVGCWIDELPASARIDSGDPRGLRYGAGTFGLKTWHKPAEFAFIKVYAAR